MPRSVALLKFCRQIHLYFGLLISPALLFFAFTGAVQTLSLHEAAGSSYKPPAVLATWGQIHKKQTWVLPVRRPGAHDGHDAGPAHTDGAPRAAADTNTAPGTDGSGSSQSAHAHRQGANSGAPGATPTAAAVSPSAPPQQPQTLWSKQKQHLPLKVFFLIVSLGLFTSTFTGIYMAYKFDRNKLLVTGLLGAGVVIPLVLLRF